MNLLNKERPHGWRVMTKGTSSAMKFPHKLGPTEQVLIAFSDMSGLDAANSLVGGLSVWVRLLAELKQFSVLYNVFLLFIYFICSSLYLLISYPYLAPSSPSLPH